MRVERPPPLDVERLADPDQPTHLARVHQLRPYSGSAKGRARVTTDIDERLDTLSFIS